MALTKNQQSIQDIYGTHLGRQAATEGLDYWSDQLDIHTNTFVVVATRGHNYDDLALRSALNTKARYIGLLGSKRKTIMIYKLLASDGIPLDRLNQVYAPVGLDIGSKVPMEIAVAIIGELTQLRRSGDFYKL